MNKNKIALILITLITLLVVLNGCEHKETKPIEKTEINALVTEAEKGEDEEISMGNRAIIAKALGLEESARKIRNIVNGLDAIGVGAVKNAVLNEEVSEKTIDITTEDGRNYRIYLSPSNSLEAVLDNDTGEWLIQSEQ